MPPEGGDIFPQNFYGGGECGGGDDDLEGQPREEYNYVNQKGHKFKTLPMKPGAA